MSSGLNESNLGQFAFKRPGLEVIEEKKAIKKTKSTNKTSVRKQILKIRFI